MTGNRDEGPAGGRRPLRPPDQALEPEDEGVHLRRAQRHLHHRPRQDRQAVPRRPKSSSRRWRPKADDPLRGHQAPGAGCGRRGSAALRHVLRQPALARRAADQLHDHPAQPRPPARPRGDGDRRPLRHAVEEGDRAQREGEAQAPEEPRRHPQDGPAARRGLRRRHAQGEDRGRRGAQAEDPGHRRRRHQLRPRRGGLRHPGQRRRAAVDPAVRLARWPTRSLHGRGLREVGGRPKPTRADDGGRRSTVRRRPCGAAPRRGAAASAAPRRRAAATGRDSPRRPGRAPRRRAFLYSSDVGSSRRTHSYDRIDHGNDHSRPGEGSCATRPAQG